MEFFEEKKTSIFSFELNGQIGIFTIIERKKILSCGKRKSGKFVNFGVWEELVIDRNEQNTNQDTLYRNPGKRIIGPSHVV